MIDASLIPEETMLDLAESTLNFARRAFQNPEIQKAYEKWAEERRLGIRANSTSPTEHQRNSLTKADGRKSKQRTTAEL